MTTGGETARRTSASRRRTLIGCLLLASLIAWQASPAEPVLVPLGSAQWSRNGQLIEELVRDELDGEPRVQLPVDGMGVRWSTVFRTQGAATHRLYLSWDPGPDGLLFEVLLDGERQPPPRDGWRPTSRHLVSDLGPRWLGDGEHLLEFIARENVESGTLVLRRLELRLPGD